MSLSEKLYKWAIQELNLVSQVGVNEIPDEECFKLLTQGKQRKIWNYVINHVRSQSAVQKVKRILSLRKLLLEKQTNEPTFDKDIGKLQSCLTQAEEKRQYLMRRLNFMENNTLAIQQDINELENERKVICHKTGVLELLRKKYEDEMSSVNVINKKLLSHVSCLKAYQSCQTPSQSGMSLGYGFLYDNIMSDREDFRNYELIKAVNTIIDMKLSSKEVDKVLYENFWKNYTKLKGNGFLLTDLLSFLNTASNSEKEQLSVVVLESVSVNDFIIQSKGDECIKQLLSQLKYDNIQYALCTLRNKKKIDHLKHVKMQLCKEKKELTKMEADSDIKYVLLETLAENSAFFSINTSLEENLKVINGKAELVKQSCRQVCDDIVSLTNQFYKSADITFYLLNTAPSTFAKLLSSLKDLQLFVQNETFQSNLAYDLLQDIKEKFVQDRKLMWEYCDRTSVVIPVRMDPYDIQYPLLPEFKKLLFVEPYENVTAACERLIDLKNQLKEEAVICSKPCAQNLIISTSNIYDSIMNMIDKMNVSIRDGEAFLSDTRIQCERNKNLLEEWWEQKAQYIPSIEYEGKSLKMWVDILHALDNFSPLHLQKI